VRTFLTEYTIPSGEIFAGEDIKAISWKDAKYQSIHKRVTVIGIRLMTVDEETGERIPEPYLN